MALIETNTEKTPHITAHSLSGVAYLFGRSVEVSFFPESPVSSPEHQKRAEDFKTYVADIALQHEIEVEIIGGNDALVGHIGVKSDLEASELLKHLQSDRRLILDPVYDASAPGQPADDIILR